MKKYFLTIFLIALFIVPTSAVKKIEANPLNIAVSLTEKNDSAIIISDLTYYGYTPQLSAKGNTEFHHSNGSVITFTMPTSKSRGEYPTIEVKSNYNRKEIDNIMMDLRFKRVGNGYERNNSRYDKYLTRCTNGSSGILVIKRIPKQISE